MAVTLNALSPTTDINTYVHLANSTKNLVRPEVFYSKQLLDTIRVDAAEYKYYKLADESPIQDKAEKLTLRRWAPLQAHTTPLVEGIPPKSDKGSVEKYEMEAFQYGRYMEFTDKVDFTVVDPVIAHYTKEYSIVAIETLDMLAREELFSKAQQYFAGIKKGTENPFESLFLTDATGAPICKPNLTDLRLIKLALQRRLVKPRSGGKYQVIVSPEFSYDMVEDPTVEQFMRINQTTKDLYDGSVLFPMFGLTFDESLIVPASGEYKKVVEGVVTKCMRIYRPKASNETSSGRITVQGDYAYMNITEKDYLDLSTSTGKVYQKGDGYVKDARTGQDASYIPGLEVWDIDHFVDATGKDGWSELKAHHILVVGKDALTRTGLSGEGSAKVYAKPKGSAGVLDPIDQRQSIGFKINSVGFGSTRLEAIVDYICIPTTANLV